MAGVERIYLDTAAATRPDKKVRQAMTNLAAKIYGNPSSLHREGRLARQAIIEARLTIAGILNVSPSEIIFTGSGTESNNLAVFGTAAAFESINKQPGHIIVSAIEHHSVLLPVRSLKKRGWRINEITVDQNGLIDPTAIKKVLRSDTALVSIGYVNNEIGTVAPLKAIAKIIRNYRQCHQTAAAGSYPYFHTDACQAAGFFPLSPISLGVDLLTLNGSKIYGPKGAGLLFAGRRVKIEPLILGGSQEDGRRSGTENVSAAVGLAAALTLADKDKEIEGRRLAKLRDYAIAGLKKKIPTARLNGDPVKRAPNNINFTFPGALAETLVLELDAKGLAVSTGSACSANQKNESHVIAALRGDDRAPLYSIRFSLGRENTKQQIDYLLKVLPPAVKKLQAAGELEKMINRR